ncbi:MAG TPA: MOSC N-terminal beta barrel domain-containing protein [Acidimicrobiia bacterium]|nr:MOSC N-terminal beta barrel domain-containing protein [Acidimicrobiia bacterium]
MPARAIISPVHVVELWRHPVKSLQGESLDEATIEDSGLAGDRRWGIVDRETGKVLTGRRAPALLLASSRLDGTGVAVRLPDGDPVGGPSAHADAVLSEWIGRPVTLVEAESFGAGIAESFADATDDSSEVRAWAMPDGRFVDALPLLVVTTASLRQGRALHPEGAWETRRFRPNIVIDVDEVGWVEDGWCGQTLRVGDVTVQPLAPCSRCTMVTRPQPGLDRDLDVFKTLARHHGSTFGVWSVVQTAGVVHVGDVVTLG